MNISYLSLGSNMGDSLLFLKKARDLLSKLGTIALFSSIYKTEPQGYKDQHWFVNQVLCLRTSLSPYELLRDCLDIETTLGRKRSSDSKFGERTIDIDVLLVEGYVIDDPDFILPHPRMKERAFVLVPLAEISPTVLIDEKNTVLEQLAKITYRRQDNTIWQ